EAFDPVEVDMGRSAANNITQSGGTEWSKRDKSTYDPTDDIEALYYPSSAEKIGQFSLPAVRMPYRALGSNLLRRFMQRTAFLP
ncbi:hypothetical protein F7F08_31135, partial [Escherichia coli]